MALEYYAKSAVNAGSGAAKFGTATEDALRARSDVTWWLCARGRSIEASSNGRFVDWRSRVAKNDAQQPRLIAPSEALGIYRGVGPVDKLDERRFGMDASDTVISGSNNRSMTGVGNTFHLPPTGDVTIAMRVRLKAPSNNTILLASQSTTTQFALSVTSTFLVRAYSDYPGTLLGSTAAIDTNPHTLIWKFDRTANTCQMLSDGVQIRAAASFTLPNYANSNLQLGFVTEGATLATGAGFALHSAICINSIDGVSSGLHDAVIAEHLALAA